MSKSYRIKAKPNEDKNIFVNLEQDFDQLEILSLKIVKSDAYSRTCADYGVVVGRAQANGGFGIPNAKVSIFIPITDEDAEDEVISQLYPFKKISDKNEEGYRYNLLPKISESCNHNATGNFFTPEEVINNPVILEVFEKYYKYTTKTNESGDYMLWGIPLGNQTIHASIDVSDIGCYSMRPYQFIRQGVSASKFESALEFKTSENLDTLPQISLQNKAIEVVPFWGDEKLCGVGITRVDFDLRDSGVEIVPSSTFIGSIITDDDSNYVSIDGVPTKGQGQLCNLTTGTGTIEAIRHTILKEDDGCTTKLEKFNLDNGGKVIDGNGAWVTQLPMNLDFLITNEYGQNVVSDDPKVGIPTKAKYRFRISFDGTGGEVRSGRYLVPNLREYTDPIQTDRSYNFSDKLEDYPEVTIPSDIYGSPANQCADYFYEFAPNRVYTVANFIDNYRKNVRGNASENKTANSRWRFLGIKTINPPAESRCTDITKEFPVSDAFRGGTTRFSTMQITRLLQVITLTVTALIIGIQLLMMVQSFGNQALRGTTVVSLQTAGTIATASVINAPVGVALTSNFLADMIAAIISVALSLFVIYIPVGITIVQNFYVVRQLYNYPNCEPCFCGAAYKFNPYAAISDFMSPSDRIQQETIGDDPDSVNNCNGERYMEGFKGGNALFWKGKQDNHPKGCYVLQFRDSVYIAYIIAVSLIASVFFIPFNVGAIITYATLGAGLIAVLIAVIISVYDIYVSLNQWRILANIYTGLCEGVFNMKFSNNWINGTLYYPKFITKQLKIDPTSGLPISNPSTQYCDRIVRHMDDGTGSFFYYRSCPYAQSEFTDNNLNVDAIDPPTEEHKGINFPTTITDLGPLDPCILELCEENIEDSDQCIFIQNLKPSSFQPTDELLGMIIERKISVISEDGDGYYSFNWAGINKFFGSDDAPSNNMNVNLGNRRLGSAGTASSPGRRRNRAIDGGIAQTLATNNQMGISVYTSDETDPYYGTTTLWHTNFGIAQTDPDNAITQFSTRISLIPRDTDVIKCIQGGVNGFQNTQVVPYYAWNSNTAYGTWDNDYDWGNVSVKGNQQGILYEAPDSEGDDGTWATPYYYDGGALPPLGYFMSVPLPPATDPPISQTGTFRLGTGLYFYFGLRQGGSAYERFINEYLPPKDDGE